MYCGDCKHFVVHKVQLSFSEYECCYCKLLGLRQERIEDLTFCSGKSRGLNDRNKNNTK